jgi:hypothetical protein
VARECHDDAGHVLVAARQRNASIMVLRACDRFDAVRYDLASLEGKPHAYQGLVSSAQWW